MATTDSDATDRAHHPLCSWLPDNAGRNVPVEVQRCGNCGARLVAPRDGDKVNHPSHYGGDSTYEVIKVLEAWGLNGNARLWNAVKYISRAGKKDPAKTIEDLKKARFYLDREIKQLEEE